MCHLWLCQLLPGGAVTSVCVPHLVPVLCIPAVTHGELCSNLNLRAARGVTDQHLVSLISGSSVMSENSL